MPSSPWRRAQPPPRVTVKRSVRDAQDRSQADPRRRRRRPRLPGVRQFGSWLDDASVLGTGNAWTAISFGHYRTPFSHQTDFPIADVSVGVTRRAQVGVTVPYLPAAVARRIQSERDRRHVLQHETIHRRSARQGPASGSCGQSDSRDAGQFHHRGGPVWMGRTGQSGIPFRGKGYRVFGSTGYFSRGAVFGSSAVEIPVQERLMITTALSVMRAINNDPVRILFSCQRRAPT